MKFFVIRKSMLIKTFIGVVAICAILLTMGFTHSASVFLGKPQAHRMPINSISIDERKIALTFDLPEKNTDNINVVLEEIKKQNIKATFFSFGNFADDNKDLIKSIFESENDLGSRGNSANDMRQFDKTQIKTDIEASCKIIGDIIEKDVNFFRPAFDKYNDNIISGIFEVSKLPIGSDIHISNFESKKIDETITESLKNIQNGSIIDIDIDNKNIGDLLPTLIISLQQKNYSIVPLSDIVMTENFVVDSNGRQIKSN